MKKYFYIGLAVILLMSVGIIVYGTYLNTRGENIIASRMDNRKLPLKGQAAQMREIQPVLMLDTIKLYSDDMADAVALIDGRITESYAKRNTRVQAGEALFSLTNEEVPMKLKQADSNILKAAAELKRAQNSYARYSRLIELDATSREKLDEAEANYRAAAAGLEEMQAQKQQLLVQVSREQVTAPIDGEVLMLYRQPGTYVQAGTAIALVGDFSQLVFSQTLDDEAIEKLSKGGDLLMELQASDLQKIYDTEYAAGNEGRQQSFRVHISEITPDLSEPASMRKVVLAVDNAGSVLEPQTYRNVRLQSQQAVRCLTVPLTALLDRDHNTLFVLAEDGTIQCRTVEAGIDDGEYIEILTGLVEGDVVITSDTGGLTEGMAVTVELEGDEQ